ncbi:PDDEXK-like family protein [Psychrobacter pacificensis]|uniref:PDDEXK-like family protein n=2 Tax=Psychrobacter pacificensis TaxID=112002 RepID=UPI001CBC4BD7|nr:PD-(D/E)XK nuclease family protein [Psychrobacter pacificensis]MBZ1392459.1 PD-(D/E)XK nuclease family protein [Psychrobacter pacificensis]
MVYNNLFQALEKIDQASTEEASNTKYGFNVFSILRRDDEEVGLHSKFLAELLSPTGSHGMDAFQKLFMDQVVNVAFENKDEKRLPLCLNQNYMCQTEVAIKNYGRIDIVLKNNENIIVIENKINAYDQKAQLQRYYEACRDMNYEPENIYILYLNKYGDPVSAYSKGNLKDSDFAQISYKEDVANWLDACIVEARLYPHIEHTLLQYRRLVGKLTGDTRSAKMKQAHIELLYQKDNFKLAHELSESFVSFQIDLQKKLWQELQEVLKKKGYDFNFCDENLQLCDRNKKIKNYYKPQKPSRKYGIQCKIGSLEEYDINCFIQVYKNVYFGMISSREGRPIGYPSSLNNLATQIGSLNIPIVGNTKEWALGGDLKPTQPIQFDKIKSLYKIANNNDRAQWIEQTTNEIVSFIESVKSLGLIDVQSATYTSHNTV